MKLKKNRNFIMFYLSDVGKISTKEHNKGRLTFKKEKEFS